jgi:hypothetical protein
MRKMDQAWIWPVWAALLLFPTGAAEAVVDARDEVVQDARGDVQMFPEVDPHSDPSMGSADIVAIWFHSGEEPEFAFEVVSMDTLPPGQLSYSLRFDLEPNSIRQDGPCRSTVGKWQISSVHDSGKEWRNTIRPPSSTCTPSSGQPIDTRVETEKRLVSWHVGKALKNETIGFRITNVSALAQISTSNPIVFYDFAPDHGTAPWSTPLRQNPSQTIPTAGTDNAGRHTNRVEGFSFLFSAFALLSGVVTVLRFRITEK